MKNFLARRLVLVLGAAGMIVESLSSAAGAPMHQRELLQRVADHRLPGRATRWDYMSIDTAHGKLVLAHLGDSAMVMVDTHSKSVIGKVGNVAQVHGVLAVPELGRIYATATGTNEWFVIEQTNLKIVARAGRPLSGRLDLRSVSRKGLRV